MIFLYLLANIFFAYTLKKKHIAITNVFVYVFWGLLLLYPMSIYCTYVLDLVFMISSTLGDYVGDTHIVNEVLRNSAFAIFTFAICMWKFPVPLESKNYSLIRNLNYYKVCFWLLVPVALYLNFITNWTTERSGLLPTMAAYSRNIITVLVVILFIPRNIKLKEKIIYLIIFMFITFLSTQRTNALIVIVALIYNVKSSRKAFQFLFCGLIGLIILGSLRSGESATNFLFPILGEGLLGSWGLLQAIDITIYKGYSYLQGFMLFNETINWFVNMLHLDFALPTLSDIVLNTGETYYPMGGFFYLSDAYLLNPYVGSIIYTGLIYWFYRRNLCAFYRYHQPLNLICLALLFDAVKGAIVVFIAMLLFHVLSYYMVKYFYPRNNS